MALLEHFTQNHAHLLYFIAGLSLLIELTIMGLSGPLFFFSMACVITAVLLNLGLISGWETEVLTVGVVTGLIMLALWRPLKRFQNSGSGSDNSSDMIGQKVASATDINKSKGCIRYSGINWNARLDPQAQLEFIPQGELCEICAVEGNVMIVKPIA